MLQVVVLVLTASDYFDAVVESWQDAGAPEITVLHSTSLAKVADRCRRDDLPLFPSLHDILEDEEQHHHTLFTIVDDEALIDRLIAVTEQHTGSLDEPGNGILITLPVGRVRGLRRAR